MLKKDCVFDFAYLSSSFQAECVELETIILKAKSFPLSQIGNERISTPFAKSIS